MMYINIDIDMNIYIYIYMYVFVSRARPSHELAAPSTLSLTCIHNTARMSKGPILCYGRPSLLCSKATVTKQLSWKCVNMIATRHSRME